VRVGLKSYRHSQVRFASDGPWRIEPPQPARRSVFDDGLFGLSGMRAFPSGRPAFASFEVRSGAAHGQLNWQVWFSLPKGASFRLQFGHRSRVVSAESTENQTLDRAPSLLSFDSALSDSVRLTTLSGAPRVYGLTAEGSEPGLVLDAIGIDGARLATTLSWNEASFEAGLRLRAPSLVALAFGTNEAFDGERIESYRAQYADFLARARRATPNVDCLIVGPPDANAVAGGSEPRVAQIDALQRAVASELGCGFVSQLEIMGGPGGYSRWQNRSPSLARGDRLHLTPNGYEAVASVIADRLLVAYEQSIAVPRQRGALR
jgi:lysophospholipase L1-like esterase